MSRFETIVHMSPLSFSLTWSCELLQDARRPVMISNVKLVIDQTAKAMAETIIADEQAVLEASAHARANR
jgi:hypothetical protein